MVVEVPDWRSPLRVAGEKKKKKTLAVAELQRAEREKETNSELGCVWTLGKGIKKKGKVSKSSGKLCQC